MKKFEYVDDNPGSYFGMLVESVKDKKELKEDKFVPQDKMSKKAQKELNDKKRGTWGDTKPVTRVQPNKKAYDRKRDSKVVKESKKLNESSDGWEFIKYDGVGPVESDAYYKDMGDDILLVIYPPQTVAGDTYDTWEAEIYTDNNGYYHSINDTRNGFNSFEEAESWINSKLNNLSESLNEALSDGWDESKLYDLSEILDEIYNLQYEVKNTVRGVYTNAHTYEELGYYVRNLGSNLMDIGDEIMEMEEEEDEEDED